MFSKSEKIPVGSLVYGGFGWQKYVIMKKDEVLVLPKGYDHPEEYLSVYGTECIASYFGLHKIGKIKAG